MDHSPYISLAPVERRNSPKEPPLRAFISTIDEAEPHEGVFTPLSAQTISGNLTNHVAANSLIDKSLLRNVDPESYSGFEFFDRHVQIEKTDYNCLLGDEVIALPIQYHVSTFKAKLKCGASLPEFVQRYHGSVIDVEEGNRMEYEWVDCPAESDADAIRKHISCIGHKFGIKDEDGDTYWSEIQAFSRREELPPRCLTDDKERKKLEKRCSRFFIHEDRLWLRPKKDQLPRLVVLDLDRRKELMNKAHDVCGHRGRDPTYDHLRERYFWPNMYDQIAYFVRSCRPCQLNSRRKPIVPYKYARVPTILRHFGMNTVHMSTGHGGKNYILHAVDLLSEWPEAEDQAKLNAANTARFIYRNIICRFGCMAFITVDRGAECSGIAEILQSQYGVTVLFSSAYHPEGNGIIERAHQTLVWGVYKCAGNDKSRWPLYLHAVLFAIRVTTSRTTGHSPYFLLYGIYPIFSFDFDDSTWQTLDWHTVRDMPTLIAIRAQQIVRRDEVAEQAHQHVRLSRKRAIDDFNRRYKQHVTFSDFEVGMWVLRHETWLDGLKGNKELWRWSGPYIIHEKRENDAYVLRELDGTVMRGHVTARRLKLFFYRSDQEILKTVSPAHFEYIAANPDAKDDELQPLYASFVSHMLNGRRPTSAHQHLMPTVTYLPGEVHLPANTNLTLPRLHGDASEIRELFDYTQLGADMCQLERQCTHTAYLAETALREQFSLDHTDLAIVDAYFSQLGPYSGLP